MNNRISLPQSRLANLSQVFDNTDLGMKQDVHFLVLLLNSRVNLGKLLCLSDLLLSPS